MAPFSNELDPNPILTAIEDKVPILHVFAIIVWSGDLALKKQNKGITVGALTITYGQLGKRTWQ